MPSPAPGDRVAPGHLDARSGQGWPQAIPKDARNGASTAAALTAEVARWQPVEQATGRCPRGCRVPARGARRRGRPMPSTNLHGVATEGGNAGTHRPACTGAQIARPRGRVAPALCPVVSLPSRCRHTRQCQSPPCSPHPGRGGRSRLPPRGPPAAHHRCSRSTVGRGRRGRGWRQGRAARRPGTAWRTPRPSALAPGQG
jgi:hypothetical protein